MKIIKLIIFVCTLNIFGSQLIAMGNGKAAQANTTALLDYKRRLFPALKTFKDNINRLEAIHNRVATRKITSNHTIDGILNKNLASNLDEIIGLIMNISGQKQFDAATINAPNGRIQLEEYLKDSKLITKATPTMCLRCAFPILRVGLDLMKQCDPEEDREISEIITMLAEDISGKIHTNLEILSVADVEQEPKSSTAAAQATAGAAAEAATLSSSGAIRGQAVLSDQPHAASAAPAATSHQNSASKKQESRKERRERERQAAKKNRPTSTTAAQATSAEQVPAPVAMSLSLKSNF